MYDLRVDRARQVEASLREAARAWINHDFVRAHEIRWALMEDGVDDVLGRFDATVERMGGETSDEPSGQDRLDDSQGSQ